MAHATDTWRPGTEVLVRGRRWRIVTTAAADDCVALNLQEIAEREIQGTLTVLTPFDRPQPVDRPAAIAVVRPRRWMHALDRAIADARPCGSLSTIAPTSIRILPYQLAPAIAMLAGGRTRILIADGVGLGKTIQAGIVLRELSARVESFRAIVLVPAGLRRQWADELDGHFGLPTIAADSSWLRRAADDWPPDVNPWSLEGIYLASYDFVKRPEVLRPLEDITWDLVIVDEAHGATTGSDRRTGVDAVASRSMRVLLLTATPHDGDLEAFDSLCRIGRVSGDELDRGPVVFQRSSPDVGNTAHRKQILLPVRPSPEESRMHDLLLRYSSQVWIEATRRRDDRARLVSIVLRKRALSSAASLASSVQRRLTLLAVGPSANVEQLSLRFDDEDPLGDDEPADALAVPGLDDPQRERRWLSAVIEAARTAARAETKTLRLLRLMRAIREPLIVFTEYRDTLTRLHHHVSGLGRPVVVLHGGMSVAERVIAARTFNEGHSTLLATDAASEGLNLHHRCRIVIHYELPWSPIRLEQRAGRVDRLGQTRRVHEIALVASNTAERLVIGPLVARAAAIRRVGGHQRFLHALTESSVTEVVMSGARQPALDLPVDVRQTSRYQGSSGRQPGDGSQPFEDLAILEARRLEHERMLLARSGRVPSRRDQKGPVVSWLRPTRSAGLAAGLLLIYLVEAEDLGGRRIHARPVAVHAACAGCVGPPSSRQLRSLVQRFVVPTEAPVRRFLLQLTTQAANDGREFFSRSQLHLASRRRARDRMSALATPPFQPGLFNRRTVPGTIGVRTSPTPGHVEHEPAHVHAGYRLVAALVVFGDHGVERLS